MVLFLYLSHTYPNYMGIILHKYLRRLFDIIYRLAQAPFTFILQKWIAFYKGGLVHRLCARAQEAASMNKSAWNL